MLYFQILMYLFIVIFGIGTIGEEDMKQKPIYAAVLCASIIALGLTYVF